MSGLFTLWGTVLQLVTEIEPIILKIFEIRFYEIEN